jgi:hypothetical protein
MSEEKKSKEELERQKKLEEEFQKKLKELQKRDPFVYKNF